MSSTPPPDAARDLPFVKMEGCGNDYVYLDLVEFDPPLADWAMSQAATLARAISDRHFGVGGDGLVLIGKDEGSDATMHMYNADGSRGEMCGNALRCIAKWVAERRHPQSDALLIATDAGPREASLEWQAGEVVSISVDMGEPDFRPEGVPFDPHVAPSAHEVDAAYRVLVDVDGRDCEARPIGFGNPHLAVFVDGELADLDLQRVGPPLERAAWLPHGANVEFVRIVEPTALEQRTWERGSGETLACGSGACAAAVAAICLGALPRGEEVEVRLRGGKLWIHWRQDGRVTMRGPAKLAFAGRWPL